MDSKTKLEKVLELVINEETEQASDLLHDIFVEKSREIYADLIEEDAEVEDVIEEDEDQVEEEDLDETIDVSDSEADFISDIEDATDEIEAEEVFGEDDDDDAEMDLSDEMSDEDDNMEGDAPAVEDAMMNVEDALEELKAAFAELTGDEEAPADEAPEMDMDAEEEVEEMAFESDDADSEELEEGADMKAVSVSHTDGSDSTGSPTGPGDKTLGNGKPIDIAGDSDETGGSTPTAKPMGVDGPQEAGKPRAVKG
jgi:hypothetical protein|tara:strand:+ start:2273 stop:3037 length:765 start_codon:yes stop_codon:yes gene_type:complete